MVRKTMTEEADFELKTFTEDMVLTAQEMEEGGLLQTQMVGTLSAERAEVRLIELSEIDDFENELGSSSPLAIDETIGEFPQLYKEPEWPDPNPESNGSPMAQTKQLLLRGKLGEL